MPLFDTQKMFEDASVYHEDQEVSSEDEGHEELLKKNLTMNRVTAWITDPMMCPRLEEHAAFMMTAEESKALRSAKQKGELGGASVSEQGSGRLGGAGQASMSRASRDESGRGGKSFKSRLQRAETRARDSPNASMRKGNLGDNPNPYAEASVRNPRAERILSRQQAAGIALRAVAIISPGSRTDSSVRGGEEVHNPLVKARMDVDAVPKCNNNMVVMSGQGAPELQRVVSDRRSSVTSSAQQTTESEPTARSKQKKGSKKGRNKDRDSKLRCSVDIMLEEKQTKKKKKGRDSSISKQKKKKTKKERSLFKDGKSDTPGSNSVRSVDWNSSGDESASTRDRKLSADDISREPQHDDADWHRVIDPSFKIRAAKPKAANSRSPANFSLNGGSIPILVVDTAVPERRMDVQKGVVLQAWGTAPIELQNVAKKTNTRSVEPSKPNGFRRLFCCGAE
mmetsp:Transcript_1411/g.2921  ORF Transcript_1411/g.2921 Transcript_1411/m.2921 type:complete len:453 (-) Transcript_1411:213-1571(-)|eukprot:CAMPEP_0114227462 /NCGR_PEP_ID=MMETSP0058-20121206/1805_1 /TAXON_ID=36894 /ORGANISM="Pyramimonas parkeae, CCMP726" /LENGTH=452 /DNA_ID=CAMNT_0001338309 /DNA_START=491 /DNA_END=1849 /DNA_ORIENTATION=+